MQSDEAHHSSAAHLADHVAAPIGAEESAQVLRNGPIGALVVASIAVARLFIGWLAFYFFLFIPRGPIGWQSSNPLRRPLQDGIVPAEVIARTEKHWLMIMGAMLGVMMAIVVVGALQPSSNVEVVDRTICPPNGPDAEAIKKIVSPVTRLTRPIPSNHLSQEVCLCSRVSKSRAT